MKIDRCPFCGYAHSRPVANGNDAFIECPSCLARGPVVLAVVNGIGALDDGASIEWNKREVTQ